jgi:hypothetical protein
MMSKTQKKRVNRMLIALSLAALLGGLLLSHWDQVWVNATLLCLSCLGLG